MLYTLNTYNYISTVSYKVGEKTQRAKKKKSNDSLIGIKYTYSFFILSNHIYKRTGYLVCFFKGKIV